MHKDDVILGVFDNALTAAEEWLEELLPEMTTEEIEERFQEHVKMHLGVELDNIRAHGHRNDDPEDEPEGDYVATALPRVGALQSVFDQYVEDSKKPD